MIIVSLILSTQMFFCAEPEALSPEAKIRIEELDAKYGVNSENLIYRNRGFFRTYFSSSLEPLTVTQVRQAMWPVIIMNAIFPCGGLWAPLIFLEDRPEFETTLIGPYFLPYAVSNLILYSGLFGAGIGVLSVYGTPISIGLIVIGCAGCVMANWQSPMASLNAWNDLYIRDIIRERNKIIEEDVKTENIPVYPNADRLKNFS